MTHHVSQALSTVMGKLEIEPEWVIPLENGFQWWPGPFAQRVWFDQFQPDRLHIETDFLRQVGDDDRTLKLIAFGNRLATLSALVLSADDLRLRLHASLLWPESDAPDADRLPWLVAAMQSADADAKARGMAEFFHAEPDVSSHPTKGARTLGHAVLRTLERIRAANEEAGTLADLDFSPLEQWEPRPWLVASASRGGLAAEVEFLDDTPTLVVASGNDKAEIGTALLQLTTDFDHPQMRYGLLARLTLPVKESPGIANMLNAAEVSGHAGPPVNQLGAWCCGDDAIVFATFMPRMLFDRESLQYLVHSAAPRALWAKRFLFAEEA